VTPSIVHRADYLTATNTVDTYDYDDGFNRLIQERKASQTAGTYVATDRLYNGVGLLASTSLPYFSSGSGFTTPTSINALYTTYTYDPLKRVLITSNAAGSTRNTYAKWTTTTTDPNGNIKNYTLDAFGNLASVVEHIGVSLATTTYAYDAANNLATTTDSYGNVRAFFYDGLGRRLSAQDLHAPGHTPFGTWYYSYDDAGNLISQVDPKGSTTTHTYDTLNRLLTESNAGATQVTNTYDSCTNGIGYLCVASSTAAKTQNAYDILGRLSYSTTTIAGINFTSSSTYDRQGNLSTLTYPNGSQVSYAYNLAGQPSRVQNKPPGSSWADIASTLTYAPQGLVTSALFGNGASSTWSFNPNVLYRLATLQTQGQGGTTIQNFAYTYDPVGNLTQIANTASTVNNGTVAYGYDSLNRLTSASTTAASSTPYIQYFSYDNLGNLLSVSNGATTTTGTTMPTIIASSTDRAPGQSSSDSFSFNAGATSSNTVLLLMFEGPGGAPTSATYNGQSLTIHSWSGLSSNDADGYLVNPAPGNHTFTVNYPNQGNVQYRVFVLNNVDQTTPFDADGEATAYPASTCPKTLTTTVANDLLVADTIGNSSINPITEGAGQTELWQTQPYGAGWQWWAGATKPATSTGSQTMSFTFNASSGCDEVMVALKAAVVSAPLAATTTIYSYPQTGYMNPDAVGSVSNGLSTTTYSYDANGNLVQAGGWSYVWDYLNHMLTAGFGGSTTTYAYDAFGSRVMQTSTTSTTYYPNKFYSFSSTLAGGTTYATSTNYIWNGDTLLATVDQPMINGTATGTPITRYLHPDHLGSTNAVTDQNGSLVQLMDYYPYGATRIATSTYPTNEKRQYIGQFSDAQTSLDYLNARYYDSARGQFVSEDPMFLGNPKDEDLHNPQSLNAYSYANDNPIANKDPQGNMTAVVAAAILIALVAILTVLTSSSPSAGSAGGSSSSASSHDVLSAASNLLDSVGHLVTNGISAFGAAAAGTSMAISASMALTPSTGVATPVIGGTAVTTPYLINSPTFNDTSLSFSNDNQATSANQLDKKVQRGQAPKTIDRVDRGNPDNGEKDHIQFKDGNALNKDGTWKHGGRTLTNAEREFIIENGWSLPQY
jgi:RHS repeat-associated protein